jgi:hypothetical protein
MCNSFDNVFLFTLAHIYRVFHLFFDQSKLALRNIIFFKFKHLGHFLTDNFWRFFEKKIKSKNIKYFLSYCSFSGCTHFSNYQILVNPNFGKSKFFNTITTVFEIGDLLVILSCLMCYEKHSYFYWNQISQTIHICASAMSLL